MIDEQGNNPEHERKNAITLADDDEQKNRIKMQNNAIQQCS